jgi:hypothetical protein
MEVYLPLLDLLESSLDGFNVYLLVMLFYSLSVKMSSTSLWLSRNSSLLSRILLGA